MSCVDAGVRGEQDRRVGALRIKVCAGYEPWPAGNVMCSYAEGSPRAISKREPVPIPSEEGVAGTEHTRQR